MKYIIMLQSPEHGVRFFTRRGKGVTFVREKATAFKSRDEARDMAKQCDLWPDAKVISK